MPEPEPSTLEFEAIGTRWSIETAHPITAQLEQTILDRVELFDRTYSRFRSDSLISEVSLSAGTHQFPDDAIPLFDLYDLLFRTTAGAVTPLVASSLARLGYDADYSFTAKGGSLPPADWSETVDRDGTVLTASEPVLIDVGAAGKGYLVDIVGGLLEASGHHSFVIDASGDLLLRGSIPQRVALEHPLDPSLAIGVVEVARGSICASGSNRRVWGSGLHHILDGRTGAPTNDVVATWALAETALVADGLATALFFAEPRALAETFDFQWVRLFASGRAEQSRDLPGELFS